MKLKNVKCPRCNNNDSTIVQQGADYLYLIPGKFYVAECKNCFLWFQNPRPSDKELVNCYPSDYSPHNKLNKEIKKEKFVNGRRLFNFILSYNPKNILHFELGYKHLPPRIELELNWKLLQIFKWFSRWKNGIDLIPNFIDKGKLLEIGVGRGKRLIELRNLGWENINGIELVPKAAEVARSEGFDVRCGAVENTLQEYPDNYFDVIIASMVLEHLSNPFKVVEQIALKLKPGGQFLFSTVCRDSLDAKIYKSYWGGFDFPRHLVHFKKKDIMEMISENFVKVEYFYQNSPVDFQRSASWRNLYTDKIIRYLASSKLKYLFGMLIAMMGLSSRISFRCRKRLY